MIDADPTVGGNDAALTDINVHADGAAVDHKAVVTAAFKNSGTAIAVHYDMVEAGGAWAVNDIRSASHDAPDYDLRTDITNGIAQATAAPLK